MLANNRKQKIIQVDCDGVAADFVWGFTNLLRERWVPDLVPYHTWEQPTWDFQLPDDIIDSAWDYIKQSDSWWFQLETLPGFEAVLDHHVLCDIEHYLVYFVTSRVGASALEQTQCWLSDLGYNHGVIVSSKKGEIAKALGAAYAIEDKAGNAVMIDYYTEHKTKSYILDYPYNRFDSKVIGSKVRRVSTLEGFLDDVASGR